MRAACVQCRVRKVRCDGSAPCCRPCERLRFDCSFQHASSTSGGYAVQLPPKRRGTEACLECRSMKARCSRESPKCGNCQRRNRRCTYASSSRSNSALESPVAIDAGSRVSPQQSSVASEFAPALSVTSDVTSPLSTITSESYLPAAELIRRYFDCLAPLPSFGFLHRETVVQRCLDGSMDLSLKLAICALTSMYLGQNHTRRMEWAQEAERLMLERLERPSIFLIQASLLIIRFRAANGQFPRAFIMAGLAGRWAVALRLNYEHTGLGPIAQEVRRRTIWSLYLLEDSFCVGLKEFELLSPEIMHLQLPCEDADFNVRRPASTGFLQSGRGIEPEILGSRAAFIKLALIRRDVMRFNRRICAKEITQAELFTCIERYQNDLLRLRTRLAPSDQYPRTLPNELPWPPQYALLHLSWHQCHCDLYRPFMPDYPELGPHAALNGISEPDRILMRDKCLSHAEEIVRILADFIHHKEEQHLLEHDVAVCTYHAARLVLFGTHNTSHGSDHQTRTALDKAQLCLDVIKQYFSFSAQLESMRTALETAIEQHKTRWKPAVSVETTPRDPDISRDAHNRQRLAIHSLLRQSDFVDDSREAALESPNQTAPNAVPIATEVVATTELPQGRVDWNIQDTMYPPWNFMPNDPSSLYGFPFATGMLDLGGNMQQGTELVGSHDEQCMY
ncbi:uncharacterized protein CC84DRAFT_1154197 [Paraphaeosphaeria sporulosa]|uniref:Zn(2)-C6 fungal-type domain-containing protein n=1 Tax=Paraphaeosphaeria sporulosa TaxID=1460663 RepID=A0A177C0D2_9PLEO|nr:uncharacterized protein CC84DRAFT_1154197 [Paraphaeosphaeria sporulosa]OAG00866.1 hypothetical protein CC84DRAFT_1154197 [Paraphaeosphaeria sporulosa]